MNLTTLVLMATFFTSFYAHAKASPKPAKKTESLTCYLDARGLDSRGGHIFLNPHKVNGGYTLIMQTQVAQDLIDNNYNTKGSDVEPLCSQYQTYYNTDIQLCAIDDGNAEGVYHVTIKMKDTFGMSQQTISLFKSRKELKTNYLTSIDYSINAGEYLLYAPRYLYIANKLIEKKYPDFLEKETNISVDLLTSAENFNQELIQMGLQAGTILMIDIEPSKVLCKLNK